MGAQTGVHEVEGYDNVTSLSSPASWQEISPVTSLRVSVPVLKSFFRDAPESKKGLTLE